MCWEHSGRRDARTWLAGWPGSVHSMFPNALRPLPRGDVAVLPHFHFASTAVGTFSGVCVKNSSDLGEKKHVLLYHVVVSYWKMC